MQCSYSYLWDQGTHITIAILYTNMYIYKRIVTYYVGLSSHGLWGLVWSLKTAYPKIKMGKKIKEHKLHRGVFTTFRLEE